jgi:hypothetical protein
MPPVTTAVREALIKGLFPNTGMAFVLVEISLASGRD